MKNYSLKDRKLSFISKILIIILWVFLSRVVNNDVIFPSIKSTVVSLIKIVGEPNFFSIIKYTLIRTLIGFLFSLFLSILMGIIASVSKVIYNMMIPILNFLNSIPTIAIIVLALIWLNNQLVPLFVGFVMVFPILYETVLNSILNVDKDIIEMAQLYKVSKISIIKHIYIPSILYNLSLIFTSVLGINLKMVIAGEVMAQPNFAIGSNLQLQRMYLNTSGVFAWIIIILLISKFFDYMVRGIRYFLGINRWK